MNKKVLVLAVFAIVVLSLTSCGSKKNSCSKVNTQEQIQQNVEIACIEVE